MASITQEKRQNEKIRLAADFSNVLLPSEAIQAGNIAVTCINALTEVNTAATILSGAPSLSGNIISTLVQNGTPGDAHILTFSTGATNFGQVYESQLILSITNSPASENVLSTRDEVKRQLKLEDTSDDLLLDDLLVSASSYIRRRTGRDFTLNTYTDVIQPLLGEDNVRLRLHHYPVQKIDRILITDEEDNVIYDVDDETTWDFLPEGYVWFDDSQYAFSNFPEKNKVTYKAGYIKVPDDVRQACKSLVIGFYRSIGREGLSEERIGDYAYKVQTTKDFPSSIRREINDSFVEGVISRYCRHDLDIVG